MKSLYFGYLMLCVFLVACDKATPKPAKKSLVPEVKVVEVHVGSVPLNLELVGLSLLVVFLALAARSARGDRGGLPLALSTGANSRHAIGTGVMGGMVGATLLGVLFVPVFFVAVRRLLEDRSEMPENKE